VIRDERVATNFTQADVDTLKAALVSGVLTVTYAGPPQRSVTYQSLAAMQSLLAVMIRQVAPQSAFRRATFSKGFDPPGGSGNDGWGGE
jgi:hypothetical protein